MKERHSPTGRAMSFSPALLNSGISGLDFLNRTRKQQQAVMRAQGGMARDIAAVKNRLTKIQNVDELLDDRQVLGVVLGSFGLESDINSKGFLRSILLSDLNDPRSTVNKLAEPKYRELAKSFNFEARSGANLPGASAIDTLSPQLQALKSVEALFTPSKSRLLARALEVFGIEDASGQTVFLKRVLSSDLSDPTSLANKIGDSRYIEFAQVFQNKPDRLPEALRGKVSDTVAAKLRSAESGADIVKDPRILRAVLAQFDLEEQTSNTSLISAVLDSDLTDPNSMANRLNDPRLQELAQAFGFSERRASKDTIYELADLAKQSPQSLEDADSLLADDKLLKTALTVFGLDTSNIKKPLLKAMLESNPYDDASLINKPENEKYAAFSKAFGFGNALAYPNEQEKTKVEKLIEALDRRGDIPKQPQDFLNDTRLYLATTNLFDLPPTSGLPGAIRRLLTTDPSSKLSPYQSSGNDNYKHLFKAVNVTQKEEVYSYPNGFADAIVSSYIERQFEISVGQQSSDMRLMLGLERDLEAAANRSRTDDGKWFRVLGNKQLITVFSTALALPDAFGQMDVDKQVTMLKEKSQQAFGTSSVDNLLEPDVFSGLQRRYLIFSALLGTSQQPTDPIVSLLL